MKSHLCVVQDTSHLLADMESRCSTISKMSKFLLFSFSFADQFWDFHFGIKEKKMNRIRQHSGLQMKPSVFEGHIAETFLLHSASLRGHFETLDGIRKEEASRDLILPGPQTRVPTFEKPSECHPMECARCVLWTFPLKGSVTLDCGWNSNICKPTWSRFMKWHDWIRPALVWLFIIIMLCMWFKLLGYTVTEKKTNPLRNRRQSVKRVFVQNVHEFWTLNEKKLIVSFKYRFKHNHFFDASINISTCRIWIYAPLTINCTGVSH